MRVRLSHRPRDERGTVAILAAGLLVTMLVLAAFVTDFGVAYVNKRQAQTTADAAVLAAAKVYSTETGDCDSLEPPNRPDLEIEADRAADTLRKQNLGEDSTDADVVVTCDLTTDELRISYEVVVGSDIVLGQLAFDADAPDQMTIERDATATFDRPMRGQSGMRPWPLCSNATDFTTPSPTVLQITAGNATNETCPAMDSGGTWDRMACPGYSGGNSQPYDHNDSRSSNYWIAYGCPNPASPIPGQPTDATLASYLRTYCMGLTNKNMPSTEFCLTRDSGNAQNEQNMLAAWQKVVNDGLTMEVPVYCAYPQPCTEESVREIQNGKVIPIYQLAVVRLCGVYLNGAATTWSPHAECNGNADLNGYAGHMNVTPGGKSAFYIVVKGVIKGADDGTTGGSSNLRLTE